MRICSMAVEVLRDYSLAPEQVPLVASTRPTESERKAMRKRIGEELRRQKMVLPLW